MALSRLLEILIYLFFFAFFSFLVHQLLPDFKRRAALARLGAAEGRKTIRSPLLRILKPTLRGLAPWFAHFELSGYRTRKQKQITAAGLKEALKVDELLAWKSLFGLVLPILVAMVFSSARHPLIFIAFVAGCSAIPDLFLKDLVGKRRRQIVRAMPFYVDLLTLVVEAGLDFSSGLQRVVDKGAPGPLRDELAALLRDIRLGTSRSEGLRALADRCDMTELSSFTGVLIQADQLGVSIGPVLRTQSDRMRAARFQAAEKRGAEAATKILFPLVLFIMPATFIIILGPIVLRFIYGLV